MPYMSSIVRSALTFQSIPTSHDLHIHGSINGLEFDMVGGGSGNPKDGSVESRVTSTKGDLPAFSPHIVAPHLGFGFYQYLPFPGGPSPYQAAIDVGGKYNEHRTIQFEDGAVLTANYRYTYKGDKIKGDFHLVGSGFPASGPVMTNSLASLDRTVAKITCVDEHSLVDNIDWTYRTSSGGSYRAMVQTNCTFQKPVRGVQGNMPMFVFRQLEVKATKTEISLQEKQKAFTEVQ
ncbi:PREDICTED: GFP-like fluorescent chromoprotein amFP486 isoform X1 [Branchiostoma belcheri]|uniref:GFP-like fluorescent chromoprotein amFP486 isoform X1 n=1 Tax=Branchiostoma belcheri TaxID=7741 RepID=A0A6P4ZFR3_BRABE|nr:PREDICTED: GFP-like fluorescent chromoprotein amFP486 isoform X1 [Branchiostoma belcheri]